MLSSFVNITWSNSSHDVIRKYISSSMIIPRTIFILSIIILFWIGFLLIYLLSRLVIRILSKFKHLHNHSNTKICQAFVISSNQYGSFRSNRSDSLFSNINYALTNEKISQISAYGTINLTINLLENSSYQQTKTNLLEHYLTTYNPLDIDLTHIHDEMITTSEKKKIISSDNNIPSETDTYPIDNCYTLHCTNKQKRYARLKEQDNCSVHMSIIDDRLSESSTQLSSTTLPIVMITDCSNSQRLHTDIIEMNEEE